MSTEEKNPFIGNAFDTQYGTKVNIVIWQLEQALGMPKDSLKKVIAQHCYDKASETFTTPALYVNKFKTKDNKDVSQLTLKIEVFKAKAETGNKRLIKIDEFVPDPSKKTESKPNYKAEPVQEAEVIPEEEKTDDLPF
jgi:hypothetical protein